MILASKALNIIRPIVFQDMRGESAEQSADVVWCWLSFIIISIVNFTFLTKCFCPLKGGTFSNECI